MARIPILRSDIPLAGAGVYTSPIVDVASFKILSGFVGTTSPGDLFLDYSPDVLIGTWINIKSFPLVTSIQFYEFAVGSFMRFRYVNGAIAQSSFSLAIYAEYL